MIPAVAIPVARTSSSQNRLCLAPTSPSNRYTAARISSGVRLSPASREAMLALSFIASRTVAAPRRVHITPPG